MEKPPDLLLKEGPGLAGGHGGSIQHLKEIKYTSTWSSRAGGPGHEAATRKKYGVPLVMQAGHCKLAKETFLLNLPLGFNMLMSFGSLQEGELK